MQAAGIAEQERCVVRPIAGRIDLDFHPHARACDQAVEELADGDRTAGADVVRPARYRPNDTPLLLGDPGRLRDELGWSAEIPLEQTLDDLLEYWRTDTP